MKKAFLDLVREAFSRGIIKKLVFSRPDVSEIKKISARTCSIRGESVLNMELYLPGDTVRHKNVSEDGLLRELSPLISEYAQLNLITTLGDAEYKRSDKGREVTLGLSKLKAKMGERTAEILTAISSLDTEKNYILKGNEDFLFKLGISSKDGRVHDKKQGKYRQINRFLEHIRDIYKHLPSEGRLIVYDLCCGKSYLSFAVYYYLTEILGREVYLYGVDLKRDVIEYCNTVKGECNFHGMHFECGDITKIERDEKPDMVISLHACDVATDVVLNTAISLSVPVILSTPCCHRYLNGKIKAESLKFISDYPHLKNKLCEAATDALRLLRLRANGYSVSALELTDPENTPKNTLIRAIRDTRVTENQLSKYRAEYEMALEFLLGDQKELYLKDI